MTIPSGASKVCKACGSDCSNKPRTKDTKGNYYCKSCYESLTSKKQDRGTARTLTSDRPAPRPKPEPEPLGLADEPNSMMDHLLALAPSAPNAGKPCPNCASAMAADAVICTGCGYNRETGQQLAIKKVSAKPSRFASTGGGAASMLLNPAVISLAILAFFGLLAAGAWGNPETTLVYLGLNGLFSLTIGIIVLISAFRESIGTGFLSLCVPFYALYFVFGVCESQWLRWLFACSLVTQIIGIPLQLQVENELGMRTYGP